MSSPWGFAVETSIHALRLCGSGLFDDFPKLKIIIGHLGEHIPYDLWRIDARMRFSPRGYTGNRPLGEYFLDHFCVTTSGNFCDPSFRCALEVMGADRMMFSADYPFEKMEDAAIWFDNASRSDYSNGNGSFCYVQNGVRRRLGQWPANDGLFARPCQRF